MNKSLMEVCKLAGNPRDRTSRIKNVGLREIKNVLVSGDTAIHSGLYALEHDSPADQPEYEEIFIRKGTTLPLCEDCGNSVKFRLLKKMAYIEEDPDFQ